jgi:hypothetical protein
MNRPRGRQNVPLRTEAKEEITSTETLVLRTATLALNILLALTLGKSVAPDRIKRGTKKVSSVATTRARQSRRKSPTTW